VTDRDEARELAAIARGARRVLEREEARGLGEMLAQAARGPRRQTARVTASPPVAIASRVAEAREATPETTPHDTQDAADEASDVPAVDLFGQPVEAPAVLAAVAAALVPPAPAPPRELNPRGWEAREGLTVASLPVLEQVAVEARACRLCGLCDTRTNAVPGVGSARSGIVFVGEAPGADEDAKGEPFVGRAGQLLTRIIQAMDEAKLIPGMPLSRETVYICNVLKCRPPENRNPLPHEVAQCSPYLMRQLESIRPRVICCLGKFAAELLLGVKGTISSLRGRVYDYRGAKLIVTYHPAACLRNPSYKRPVWEDMQLLAREYLTD
jgi:DNA polymerase